MLISVVMPYSGSPTLKQALQSLQNQTIDRKSFELILVGEAGAPISERNLRELFEFQLTYIQYKRKNNFRGHSAGRMRNLGAAHARSKIILFIDSDCLVGPSCLRRHHIWHTRHDGCVVCGGVRELPIYEHSLLSHYDSAKFAKLLASSATDFRETNSIPNCWENFYSGNASVPRDLFREVGGFDESGFRCHDMDLGYRLYREQAMFRFAPDCQAIHIEHPRSIGFRLQQAQGWRHLGEKHREIKPFAEDYVVILSRGFTEVLSKCEAQFSELTSSLPGIRVDSSWIAPAWYDAAELQRLLNRFPYYIVQHPSHRQAFLRLDPNCWDFSILHVEKEVLASPNISILLTTFNSQATVARAIESVFRQTLQSFELVVIDDGSTDDTERIVRSFAIDGRVRLSSNHENRGLARSLNRGLELCTSPIVLQLDSDDWLEPHALECVCRKMNSDPTIGAVYGRAITHDGVSRVEETGYQANNPSEYLEYPHVQAPRAYRVHLLKKLGGWSIQDVFDGRYFEDRLTLSRVSRSAPVSFIDAGLHNVDVSLDSLSRRDPFRSKIAKLLILSAEANAMRLGLTISSERRVLKPRLSPLRKCLPRQTWSVVVPAHERPELLEYALRSWIESDLSDARSEIIVVDDGSRKPLENVVRSVSDRIRYVRLERRHGPAHARNIGASLARYGMLFFSDADRIVPPDVLGTHEARHAGNTQPCVVVGGLFGRKAATFLRPRNLDMRICQKLLEQFRFDERRFLPLAEACLTGKAIRMIPVRSSQKLWNSVERLALADSYLSQWAASVLVDGWDAPARFRFLRLGTGNVSMSARTFFRIGEFDSAVQPMEDWEFGIRALKSKVQIISAPEAESYHQLHEIDPFLSCLHVPAMRRFQKKHPEVCQALFEKADRYAVPGMEFIRNKGIGPVPRLQRQARGQPQSSYSALTFDDGPHPVGTPRILQALRAHRAAGTFFVLGAAIAENKGLLRLILESGSEIGVHGWIHRRVDEQTTREIIDDLSRTIDAIQDACGRTPRFCRPSYGVATPAYLAAADKVGLETAGWHVSSRDWQDLGRTDLIVNLSLQTIREKVLLFHDGCGTLASNSDVLHWLLQKTAVNAKFVGLSKFAQHILLPKLPLIVHKL